MSRTTALSSLTAALALSLTLAACGTEGTEPGGSAGPTATTTTAPTPAPTTPAPTTDEDEMTSSGPKDPKPSMVPVPTGDLPLGDVPSQVLERPEVQAAIEAEAERTGVEPDAVTVAGFAEVTWRDGSLGCPVPGMMYTQALVPGQQLVLEVDGQYASYHAGRAKTFNYCANPQPPTPGGATS